MRQLKITHSITLRENECLKRYLNEIAQESLLTPQEEEKLAASIKKGDQTAMNKLIKSNLRFVVSVAKQYQNQGMTLEDLINEGNIGLIKAAQRFDATKGFRFISYAVWWIRQTIMIALMEKVRLVRVPFNQVNQISKIKKLQNEFEQKNGREMNLHELAEKMSTTAQALNETMALTSYPVSFDSPVGNDEDHSPMHELFADQSHHPVDHELNTESVKHDVRLSLMYLKPREREVVKMYFGIEYDDYYSVEQIADRLEITRERVRQVKDKALKKLKSVRTVSNLKMHLC
jgi:RNA polymerase primary sigma factor